MIDAVVDVGVLRRDDHCQVGCVGLDERLHEHVLVMVVQVQQIEQVGDAGEDCFDLIVVCDVETAGLDRRVDASCSGCPCGSLGRSRTRRSRPCRRPGR